MTRRFKARNNTSVAVWLLSLTLFFSFAPSASTGHRYDKQASQTEWVARPVALIRRSFANVSNKLFQSNNLIQYKKHGSLYVLKIVASLFVIQIFRSVLLTCSMERIQLKHVRFASCSANYNGSSLYRG